MGLTIRGAELGVYRGEFAETILSRWPGRLLLVDPWRYLPDYLDSWNADDCAAEKNLAETCTRLASFTDRIDILRRKSADAANLVADQSLDFVYIDANHSYESTSMDLKLWYPKVRAGGLVSGHDYFDALADDDLEPDLRSWNKVFAPDVLTSYGVKSAVDQFARDHGYHVSQTDEDFPTWYFVKQ
ncbi:class I SAM-dependent methyltransferase [Allosphingosinicella sp.]|jgi:hypothetical protein|uniref:class I SAM-dependent methyltransferase n=1 Tax=Allosphingosinicella sp. TaxID=2823234 RepID=UPI002EFBF65C